jgi:hypothetical protein
MAACPALAIEPIRITVKHDTCTCGAWFPNVADANMLKSMDRLVELCSHDAVSMRETFCFELRFGGETIDGNANRRVLLVT